MRTLKAVPLLALVFAGCTATLGGPGEAGSDGGGLGSGGPGAGQLDRDEPCDPSVLPPSPVRRLSHGEYRRSIEHLFPGLAVDLPILAADRAVHGYENFASQLNPSDLLVEQYLTAAVTVAEAVVARGAEFLPCDPTAGDDACRDAFLGDFATELFRRPLDAGELERFGGYFDAQRTAISFRGAMELTLASLLISPQFLYRLELSTPGGNGVPLDDYEMATRLSYFLWQSTPDAELLAAAGRGELRTEEQIVGQAERMLGDPRAEAAFVDFHRQWLGLDKVVGKARDPSLFPEYSEALATEIVDESRRFVGAVFRSETPTLASLFTSTTAEVTAPIASLYGVTPPESGIARADLPSNERSGILTRAAFNAAFAKSTNGSPPLRGVAVLDRILCMHPPAPPANVDLTVEQDPNAPKTNRQLFEAKTSTPSCRGCHSQIDGIGFTLENFDAIGKFRSTDNGETVDASGELIGTDNDGEVANALELSTRLAESESAEYCSAVQWYRYAFGRDEAPSDWCRTDPLYETFDESGGDLKKLLLAIVRSPEFLHRAPVATTNP